MSNPSSTPPRRQAIAHSLLLTLTAVVGLLPASSEAFVGPRTFHAPTRTTTHGAPTLTTPIAASPFATTATATAPTTATALHLQRPVGGRHFNLEELEDSEASTTDVLLNSDLTVTLGETNGPMYVDGHGTWSESCQYMANDQSEGDGFKRYFTMKITRRFITGNDNEGTDSTDVGEFEYSVERTYSGECFLVAGTVFAMNGEILDVDEMFGERKVGFFNMIDTSEERENDMMD